MINLRTIVTFLLFTATLICNCCYDTFLVVTNRDFTTAFGKAMWRPALIPLPEFALNFVFGNERAKIMTEGQKVIPKRVKEYGFEYKYPDIVSACRECAKMFVDEPVASL